ncbi:hypothetical protein BGZ99_008371, partial [Dissophora globulifera]
MVCATPTPTTSTSNSTKADQYPDRLPKIITTPAPLCKQSVLLHKNGLPIKSAMKSPVVTVDPICPNTPARSATFVRSHTSPTLCSPKYVHFNTQLEHVRLFLQGETPSCVAERETIIDQESASTSDLKLTLTNWSPVANGAFRPGNIDTGAAPLKVESMTLSEDQSELFGTILIHNIAFHKHVSVRYTIDFWQTQSEISAEFKESIPGSALDRFVFKIALDMEKSKVEKTFCFAVRYQVIGREFWDSNNGMNYQVECKRVVVVTPLATPVSDLSKQMTSILLASRMPDYSKPVLRKKNNRYDLSTSLSTACSQPVSFPTRALSAKLDSPISQTAYRPSEYIMPVLSPPGYHHSLYASSPKFLDSPHLSSASSPDHYQIEFDQPASATSKRGSRKSWSSGTDSAAENGFYGRYSGAASPIQSSPITIPAITTTSASESAERPQVGSSSYFDLVDRYCFYESSPHSSPYSSYPNSPTTSCIQ